MGNMTLGEIIRHHRQQQGLSQPELANKAQIEQSYLSKLENDNSFPSDDILNRVMAALNLDIATLCAQLDTRSADPKVMHIESIRTYLGRLQATSKRRNVVLMALFTLTISIGCALFYTGYSKAFFAETLYSYESEGEVRPGEPIDYFLNGWARPFSGTPFLTEEETLERRAAHVEKSGRVEYHTIQSFTPLENRFIRTLDNGNRRLYRANGTQEIARPQNAWLMFFGIFLAVNGLIGLIICLRSKVR